MGAIQPSTSTEETLHNAGLGILGSAVAPVIGRGLTMAKSAAEPFYKEGQNQILARLLQKTAGGEATEVAQRLHGAFEPMLGPQPANKVQPMPGQMAGELIPGSVPTLAQAAQNPGIGALERSVAQTDPAASLAIANRLKAQNEARAKILQDMSGSEGARDFHDAARETTSKQLYGDAFKTGINPKVAEKLQPQISSLMENPAIKDAIPTAQRLAKYDKIDLADPKGSLQGMHYLKLALDDAIGKAPTTGVGKTELRKMMTTKDELLGVMDELSPQYGKARAEFQAASKPINQMDIAADIAKKATNPLTEQIQPQAYARALSDDTAKRATGFKKATLTGIMEPEQLGALNAIKEDLARAKNAENVGRGPGSDTIQKLAYSNMVDAAGVPNFVRSMKVPQIAGNLAGRGADALYGMANKTMSARLAEILANPEEASKLLMQEVNKQPSKTAKALRAAGAVSGSALPASINATQQ